MTVESLYIRTELGIMSKQLKSLCRPHRLEERGELGDQDALLEITKAAKKAVCSLCVSATPGQWSRGLSSQGPFGAGQNKSNERTRLPRGVAVSLRLAVMVIESINTRTYE